MGNFLLKVALIVVFGKFFLNLLKSFLVNSYLSQNFSKILLKNILVGQNSLQIQILRMEKRTYATLCKSIFG